MGFTDVKENIFIDHWLIQHSSWASYSAAYEDLSASNKYRTEFRVYPIWFTVAVF